MNCKNVIPQLRDWHRKYEKDGLTIVGVHAPEFTWERRYDKVVKATKELKVPYPVVQDNEFTIWKRFGNQYWPALVVVDRKGVVRYTHIGEGAYEEMENQIQSLIKEASPEAALPEIMPPLREEDRPAGAGNPLLVTAVAVVMFFMMVLLKARTSGASFIEMPPPS